MSQKTDLNVSPYYDDFDETDNFHRVLYRPSFAVQARELTTQQSILQNQIEKMGRHIFKEGAIVIPGEIGVTDEYYAVKLQSSFNGSSITSNASSYVDKIITGATSGVQAQVVGFTDADSTDPLTLFVKYIKPQDSDRTTLSFSDGENISADGTIGSFSANQESAVLQATDATATGSAAYVNEGVYFIRGHFVRSTSQRLILDKYSNTPSYRVGFTITENLITPESDTSLLDNATGSSNENAKGAHRLNITLTLSKLTLGSTADQNFVELLRISNGRVQAKARPTEYSVLGDNLARRTFDESGHYTVRRFQVNVKESLDDGLNQGVYTSAQTTDDGATPSDSLMTLQLSPGKAYVRGYEIEKSTPTFLDLEKSRTTDTINGAVTPVEVGNFVKVTNVYGSPDISPEIAGEIAVPYREVSLHDNFTFAKDGGSAARGTEAGSLKTNLPGNRIGVARARGFELDSGSGSENLLTDSSDNDAIFRAYLFDIKMFTELVLSDTPSGGITVGDKITGVSSGANGFLESSGSGDELVLNQTDGSGTDEGDNILLESGTAVAATDKVILESTLLPELYLTNVTGTFTNGEKIKSSGSTETDEILESADNVDISLAQDPVTFDFGMVHSMFMDDPTDSEEDFTADTVQDSKFTITGTITANRNSDTLTGFGTLFTTELRVGDVLEISSGTNGASEEIVIEEITSDTQAKFYVLNGLKILSTSATTRVSNTATFTSTSGTTTPFSSSNGVVLAGTGTSRTVVIKDHSDVKYNGKFLIEYKTDTTVEYTVAGTPTTPDSTIGIAHIVALSNNVSSIPAKRIRTTLADQEKNILLRKLQKRKTKTLLTADNNGVSDTSFVFRRQFVGTINSSGAIALSAGTNETFNSVSNTDYIITIIDDGSAGGTGRNGDIVDASAITSSGVGTGTLTFTSSTVFGTGGDYKVKIIATLTKTSAAAKIKSAEKCFLVSVDNDGVAGGAQFGSSAHHKDISLGHADAFRLRGVFESADSSTNAKLPQFTTSVTTGTFTKGERIKGGTSGAVAEIVNTISPITYVLKSGVDFSASETVTGVSSGSTAVVGTLTAGSTDVTQQYTLDTGQRDNFYDISKVIRKPGQTPATGRLLIVFDYFEHSSGDFFTVDSYSSAIDYDDIPQYSATRIDPDQRQPAGIFNLEDAVDFRPRVADSSISTTANYESQGQSVDKVTGYSFHFAQRSFTGTGASVINIPKDNSSFIYDVDFFLARKDKVMLTTNGDFEIKTGIPAEDPIPPKNKSSAENMEIANLSIPAYTEDVSQVDIEVVDNKRFTMRDIGRLEKRIERVEEYTTLNLLEQQAEALQVQDANGLDRFKTGFVVDNFQGHNTGDVTHKDYSCSIDYELRELRPKYNMKGIKLIETNTTDATRTSAGYQKTGDLLTLPYTDVATIDQPYATKVENVNGQLFYTWVGDMTLTPSGDEWFETELLPTITINREGNFDQILQQAGGSDALGTVWNAWETVWSTSGGTFTRRVSARRQDIFRRIIDNQVRTGTRTFIGENFNIETVDERIVRTDVIPFIRSRNVSFNVTGMYPKMRVYPFFDKTAVSTFCTPDGGTLSGTTTTNTLPTSVAGNWSVVSKIQFKYDNNGTEDITAKIEVADDPRGFATTGTHSDLTNLTIAAGSNATYNVTLTSDRAPNSLGESFFKFTFTNSVSGGTTATNRLYEVRFFDSDDVTVIANASNSQIEAFENFTNPANALLAQTNPPTQAEVPTDRNTPSTLTVNLFNGTRTITPESGTSIKVLPGDEESDRFVTGPTGSVSGIFNIPDPLTPGNPRFETGDRLFRLTSSPTNAVESVRTFAEAIYSAKGTLNVVQQTATRTRDGIITRDNVREERLRRTSQFLSSRRVDPLSQSFICDTPGGEFITKLDLYFSQKDTTAPIMVQLREMYNGYPTDRVLPFGQKTLQPEDVNVSSTAATATTFTFDSPIYLEEGIEYCFTVLTDSRDYLQWISVMGELDVIDGRLVNDQPHLGALFKSQNNSTWTAYQFEDMKFTLYRADFTTTGTSNVALANEPVPTRTLETNSIKTISGLNKIKVIHPNHQMYNTSNNVTISGASSGVFTTLSSSLSSGASSLSLSSSTGFPGSGTIRLKITSPKDANGEDVADEVVSGTISGTTVSSLTRGVEGSDINHASGASVELYQVAGIPLTEINKTHTAISEFGIDYYTLATTTNATATSAVGGSAIVATENAQMDAIKILLNAIEYNRTTINGSAKTTTGTSPDGTQTPFNKTTTTSSLPINENFFFDNPRMICSSINETNELSTAKSFELNLALTTTESNLSPVIDLDKASIITIANRLDNVDSSSDIYPTSEFVPATEPDSDSNEAIYLTRQVQLTASATQLNVLFDAVRPSSSEIQVMFKILRSDDSTDFDDLGYTFFNTTGTTDVTTNPSTTADDFIEHEYTANDLGEFIAFQIKIRLQGTNSSEPPRIKRLRVVATA